MVRHSSRRRFLASGMLAAGQTARLSPARPAAAKVVPVPPGIKISVQSPAEPPADYIRFLKQLGVEYVNIGSSKDMRTAEGFIAIKRRYEPEGIQVWNIGNTSVHNMEEVTLNLPGRDQKIAEYKQHLRNLAAAGIHYTTYAHMGNGIWSSARTETRGAATRQFDMNDPNKVGSWDGRTWKEPLSHGREFSEQEIWDNYTYFIRQVVPLVEELGIRIGIHPDDPPAPRLAGVPRPIFSSFDGYRRALEIANSPNVGMCLCIGCWLEGGKRMGKDVLETIQYFGSRKKLFKVHFRNVDAPLPRFVETFMDNGYFDMSKAMRALEQVKFDGVVILDHTPSLVGGNYAQIAYGVAYMRALMSRV
jgi:mannonate dehydratase